MGAELVRLGPEMRCRLPCGGGGGQYQVVVAGTLVHEGEELPRLSCRFATADESECEIEAGPPGLALLVLQFPVPWRRDRSAELRPRPMAEASDTDGLS